MESITVSPNKIANIRRTLVNNSVPPTVSRTPADYDSDEDDDEYADVDDNDGDYDV